MPLLVTQHYTFFAFQFFFFYSIIVTAMEFIPSKTWFFTSVCRKNLEAKMLKLANKLYHIRHNKIMGELKSFAVIIHPVVRKHHVVIIYFLETFDVLIKSLQITPTILFKCMKSGFNLHYRCLTFQRFIFKKRENISRLLIQRSFLGLKRSKDYIIYDILYEHN